MNILIGIAIGIIIMTLVYHRLLFTGNVKARKLDAELIHQANVSRKTANALLSRNCDSLEGLCEIIRLKGEQG